MVISISRRCDIPRFRFDWLLEKLEAGFVDVVNPYNAAQFRRVSLKPENTEFLVFWTRDPRALVNAPASLEVFPFYIMTSLTGYPKILEPNMPEPEQVINAMKAIKEKWGPKRIIWRYDPIILTSVTDMAFHIRNFKDLAARLSNTVDRVIISIYDEYGGAKRRLNDLEKDGHIKLLPHYDQDGHLLPEIKDMVVRLAEIANDAGIEMQSCAEQELSSLGIKTGACIDAVLIKEIAGDSGKFENLETRDKNQRPNCLCAVSVDIGSYGSCPAGCVYCYAWR